MTSQLSVVVSAPGFIKSDILILWTACILYYQAVPDGPDVIVGTESTRFWSDGSQRAMRSWPLSNFVRNHSIYRFFKDWWKPHESLTNQRTLLSVGHSGMLQVTTNCSSEALQYRCHLCEYQSRNFKTCATQIHFYETMQMSQSGQNIGCWTQTHRRCLIIVRSKS